MNRIDKALLILLAIIILALVIVLALLNTSYAQESLSDVFSTLDSAFENIERYTGKGGYIVNTFFVHEDNSASRVYIVYDGLNQIVYQWPEWSVGKVLG